MEAILFIAILFGLSWLYYTVKEKAKRNLLFKNQYETQKALTHGDMLITTTAAIDDVRASLDRYSAPDDSVRAVFRRCNQTGKPRRDDVGVQAHQQDHYGGRWR